MQNECSALRGARKGLFALEPLVHRVTRGQHIRAVHGLPCTGRDSLAEKSAAYRFCRTVQPEMGGVLPGMGLR